MKTITLNPEELAREIIHDIYGMIVKYREDLKVRVSKLGRSYTISIRVHKADHGRAIGGDAAHITAINHLTRLFANSYGTAMEAVLLDPATGESEEKAKFDPKDTWDSGPCVETLRTIGEVIFDRPFTITVDDGENYRSNVDMTVDQTENRAVVALLVSILTPLVNAIGKNAGRNLTIQIAAPEKKVEPVERFGRPGGGRIAKLPGRA